LSKKQHISYREDCISYRVRDIARKLPDLVWPSDYYTLLVMQVGSDEITDKCPKATKRDFRALG